MPDLHVPMANVARFIRQLSHDLRNHLNAAELQSAYISEIAEDPELKDEVKRLRGMLGEMGNSLQRLTSALAPVKLTEMPYEARAFVEDLRQKVGMRFAETSDAIEWDLNLNDESLEIDPQILQEAMLELFTNAFLHTRGSGPIRVAAAVDNGEFAFALHEPKDIADGATEQWGMQPFGNVKHGHYGLGLPRVRSVIAAHRGRLDARHDAATGARVTTVILPLSSVAA